MTSSPPNNLTLGLAFPVWILDIDIQSTAQMLWPCMKTCYFKNLLVPDLGGRVGCEGMDTGLRIWAATVVRRAGRMTETAQPHFPHCPDPHSLQYKMHSEVCGAKQTADRCYRPSIFYQDDRRRTADTVEYLWTILWECLIFVRACIGLWHPRTFLPGIPEGGSLGLIWGMLR